MTHSLPHHTVVPDDILVKANLRGDTAAFGALVNKYRGAVYSVAFGYLRDGDQAEDVAQETFLNAYMNLKTLHDPSRLTIDFCLIFSYFNFIRITSFVHCH